jgi:predicted N-acetyltransferase YhbS
MRAEIRAARVSELPAVFDLLEGAFPEASRELFVAQTECDSTFRLEQARVAVVDGEIAGHVRIFARTMMVRGMSMAAGGIGAVATRDSARGSGVATALLRDAIAEIQREGMPLSFLFTGIMPFYERLGYRVVPQASFECDAQEASLTHGAGAHAVRAATETDVSDMLAIYDAAIAERTGAIIRSAATWRDAARWLHEDSGGCFIAGVDGRPVAYLRSRCRASGHQILEAEHLAGHAGAIDVLLAAVARRAIGHGEQISALVPVGHALAAALRALPSTRESQPPSHPMMVQVLVDDPQLDAAFDEEPVHFWNSDRI